jgi:hypothetical protein
MHIQWVKLYGTIITGHVLWDVLMFPNRLKPSKHSPSLTFLLSTANSSYKLSNNCHAWPSTGCLNTPSFVRLLACHLIWANNCHAWPSTECLDTPSFVRPLACHLIWGAVCCDINNLCSCVMSGNHRNCFTGRFLLNDIGWPSSSK